MSAALDARRARAAKHLSPYATLDEIDDRIRERMTEDMGAKLSLAVQAAEDGKLGAREFPEQTKYLKALDLIELRAGFWHLTAKGEHLMSERRRKASAK